MAPRLSFVIPVTLTLSVAACRSAPLIAPAPVRPIGPVAVPQPIDPTAPVLAGTARPISDTAKRAPATPSVITARDTSHLDSMEVTRRAVEVFGDSVVTVAKAADSAPNEPSWDIEVRSYQTTARVE